MLQGMIDEVTSMFAYYFRQQLGGGLPLPVELTLRYAMGNMDPLTNSPGTLYNAITMKSIVNAFNMKSNTVAPHHYHGMDERIVQAAYNNFSYQRIDIYIDELKKWVKNNKQTYKNFSFVKIYLIIFKLIIKKIFKF